MPGEKKKKGRRAYLDDYAQGLDGRYIYKGRYCRAEMPPGVFRREIRSSCVFLAFAFVFFIWAGFQCTGSTGVIYVVMPFAVSVLPMALAAMDAVTLLRSGGRLRAHIHDRSVPRIRVCAAMSAGLLSASSVGQMIYMLAFGNAAQRTEDGLFLLGCGVSAALNAALFGKQRKIKWKLEKVD